MVDGFGTDEAAARVGVEPHVVRHLLRSRQVRYPLLRDGRKLVWRESEVDELRVVVARRRGRGRPRKER